MPELKLPNEIKLPYVEQGDPSGVPVLLLHGYPDSWRSFEPVLPHLAQSIHGLALTQRGHGGADRPAAGYRPHDFAADLAAFMDTLGLGPAVIAGHSMGSFIAQRFAMDHPERTLGLVLMGSFPTLRGNRDVEAFWDVADSQLRDPIDPGFVREFQQSTLARPVAPALLETAVEESLKVPARVWRAAFEGMFQSDFTDELGKIRAPTLIAWGDRETFFPRRDQEVLLAGIPGAQLVLYPGGGHAFHWEEPARFAADLAGFAKALVQ